MAIKSFGDERTMRIDRGDGEPDLPPDVMRRLRRILRAIDAAPDLATLRAVPSLRGAVLADGACAVPIGRGWTLTFRWAHDDAWFVRLEEAR